MPEPIHRGGTWWHEQPDGSWLRWDTARNEWQSSTLPPPPESPGDIQIPAAPPPTAEPSAGGPFNSLDTNATWAIRWLKVAVVLAVVGIVSGFLELSLIDRLASGEIVGAEAEEAADDNDNRQATIVFLQLLVFVLVVVPFLKWLSRAYRNLPALGADQLRFSEGWAVGAWFVPILNFIRPKSIVNDIWRASDPELPARQEGMWEGRPVPPVINWWWALWVVQAASTVVTNNNPKSVDSLRMAATSQIIGDTTMAVAGILLIYVIRAITARQKERASRMSAAGLGTMAPPL